jgi:hypothetical protein
MRQSIDSVLHKVTIFGRCLDGSCVPYHYEKAKEGEIMANRKQFSSIPPVNAELVRLLDASRERQVTEDELREQRISFAFGNALSSDRITKDSVRFASQNARLLPTRG